jgi:hypothetical protein
MAELRKLIMAGDYELVSSVAEPIAWSLVGDLRSEQRHRPSFEVLVVGDTRWTSTRSMVRASVQERGFKLG